MADRSQDGSSVNNAAHSIRYGSPPILRSRPSMPRSPSHSGFAGVCPFVSTCSCGVTRRTSSPPWKSIGLREREEALALVVPIHDGSAPHFTPPTHTSTSSASSESKITKPRWRRPQFRGGEGERPARSGPHGRPLAVLAERVVDEAVHLHVARVDSDRRRRVEGLVDGSAVPTWSASSI